VFAEYAESGIWKVVHLGQFAGMAILLAGLLALFVALDAAAGTARWTSRFGAASALATLALYGVLQAVDGIALKQAVSAWASAPDAEKAARFASAEQFAGSSGACGATRTSPWASLCSCSRPPSHGPRGYRG
jgi:hypothetical protein